MAIAVLNQSSLTLTASEQTVYAAVTTGKTVVLDISLQNAASGDVIELYCYTKVAGTGDTARLYFKQSWANAVGTPHYQTIPVSAPYSVEFKMKQPAGTGRAIPFVVYTID